MTRQHNEYEARHTQLEQVVQKPARSSSTASIFLQRSKFPIATALFWNRMRSDKRNRPEDSTKDAIEHDVVQPTGWLSSAEGVAVAFIAYEGGCYVCTPDPVTVTWAGVKPLLSRNAVVP